MKNFKIAMIIVAAVAFFCSCGEVEPPTVAFVDSLGMNEMTFDLSNPSADVVIAGQIEDEKGINTLNVTRTMYDANDEVVGKALTYDFEEPYDGLTEYTFAIAEVLTKADVADAAKVVYEMVATNKKGGEATATYTVNIKAPSFTESNLRWYRCGNTKEGLAEVGLNWDSQTKDILANIKPVAGAKLYILEAADYNVTSIDALNAKLTTEATVYRAISATQNGTYDDVIATVYNGKTYLMHITKSTATSETAGTAITVTGTMKTFTNAVAAK